MMKAGTYWVGDLCYVMGEDWREVCDVTMRHTNVETPYHRLADGTVFALCYTAYGDGTYLDNENRNYPVDAGLIGCILVDDIKNLDTKELDCGNIIEFTKDFELKYNAGMIEIGDVHIDTDGSLFDFDEDDVEADRWFEDDVDIEDDE